MSPLNEHLLDILRCSGVQERNKGNMNIKDIHVCENLYEIISFLTSKVKGQIYGRSVWHMQDLRHHVVCVCVRAFAVKHCMRFFSQEMN